VRLEELLDLVTERRKAGDLKPVRPIPDPSPDPTATTVLRLVADPHLRPEHRARIYADLEKNRDLLLKAGEPRLAELIFWSEHVESLYKSFRGGALATFHYVRALEATCRRCDFELLHAMSRMEDLGRAWGSGQYEEALGILVPAAPAEEAEETPELNA